MNAREASKEDVVRWRRAPNCNKQPLLSVMLLGSLPLFSSSYSSLFLSSTLTFFLSFFLISIFTLTVIYLSRQKTCMIVRVRQKLNIYKDAHCWIRLLHPPRFSTFLSVPFAPWHRLVVLPT